jgi:RNA-binding protein YlmH
MDDELLLKRKLKDTANKAYQQNIYTYTNFLSISELDLFYKMSSELSFIQSNVYGGSPSCERQIVCFGSEQDFGYPCSYPIDLIKISPLIEKFADTLTHRDYLGAILNLGIERSLVGDIVIKGHDGYLFCMNHISEYIIENLTKIKHTNVKCERTDITLTDIKPTLEDMEIICASSRVDAVVASLTKLSRSKALEYLQAQKVFINGRVAENNSYQLKSGDILVIRGLGKFIYQSCGELTRKGRVYIKLQRYV